MRGEGGEGRKGGRDGGGTDPDEEFKVGLAGCGGSAEVQAEALAMTTGRAARVRAERWERESSDEVRMYTFMLGRLCSCGCCGAELFHTGKRRTFCMLVRIEVFIFPLFWEFDADRKSDDATCAGQ